MRTSNATVATRPSTQTVISPRDKLFDKPDDPPPVIQREDSSEIGSTTGPNPLLEMDPRSKKPIVEIMQPRVASKGNRSGDTPPNPKLDGSQAGSSDSPPPNPKEEMAKAAKKEREDRARAAAGGGTGSEPPESAMSPEEREQDVPDKVLGPRDGTSSGRLSDDARDDASGEGQLVRVKSGVPQPVKVNRDRSKDQAPKNPKPAKAQPKLAAMERKEENERRREREASRAVQINPVPAVPLAQMEAPKEETSESKGTSPRSPRSDPGLHSRYSKLKVEHNKLFRDNGCLVTICEHNLFEPICLLVIVCNALWIGVELDMRDPDQSDDDTPLHVDVIENVFCAIFTLEILLRLAVYKQPLKFFTDPQKWLWNVFDLFLVLLLIVETWILKFATEGVDLPALSSLRLLRLLRIVRVLRMVPELAMMVKSLVAAIRSVSMTFVLAVGIMYIFSILLTQWARDYEQVGCDHPINCVDKAFGTISKSFLTLMQILCFDATFSLIRAILEESIFHGLLLILFILIAAFTVLNMLIGVVCEIVSETNNEEREKAMRERVVALFATMDSEGSGYISRDDMKNPALPAMLGKAGIDNEVLRSTLSILENRHSSHVTDHHNKGRIELDEFLETIFKLLHPPEAQDILLILRKLEKLEKALTDNVVILPKNKAPVGPPQEVQKKIQALQLQVAAMTRHVLEASTAAGGGSLAAEAAWDYELRTLDVVMERLRIRLERCMDEASENADPDSLQVRPEDMKHWRRLCGEVVQSLSATAKLIGEGLKVENLAPPPPPEPKELVSLEPPPIQAADISKARAPKCPQGHTCMFFYTPEDGWLCDSCESEQAAGTGMWGCRQCEHDFCRKCAAEQDQIASSAGYSIESQKAPKCLVGHTCEAFITDEDGWTCDICRLEQESGTPMWGCRQCEQDFCQNCSERQLKAPKCLLGHICTLFVTDEDGWVCDICRTEKVQGTEMWACRPCEQDFCSSCALVEREPRRPFCFNGHACESFMTTDYGWICDVCNEEQVERTEMWGCRRCEFDSCMRCAAFSAAERDRGDQTDM